MLLLCRQPRIAAAPLPGGEQPIQPGGRQDGRSRREVAAPGAWRGCLPGGDGAARPRCPGPAACGPASGGARCWAGAAAWVAFLESMARDASGSAIRKGTASADADTGAAGNGALGPVSRTCSVSTLRMPRRRLPVVAAPAGTVPIGSPAPAGHHRRQGLLRPRVRGRARHGRPRPARPRAPRRTDCRRRHRPHPAAHPRRGRRDLAQRRHRPARPALTDGLRPLNLGINHRGAC
jgi:hypothetical protein